MVSLQFEHSVHFYEAKLQHFFSLEACHNLFLRTFFAKPETKHGQIDHGLLEDFHSIGMLWLCTETHCCYDSCSTEHKLSSIYSI